MAYSAENIFLFKSNFFVPYIYVYNDTKQALKRLIIFAYIRKCVKCEIQKSNFFDQLKFFTDLTKLQEIE